MNTKQFDHGDERMDRMDQRFDDLEARMNEGFAQMLQAFNDVVVDVDSRTKSNTSSIKDYEARLKLIGA